MPRLKSVIVGPSAPKDPLLTVIPSLLREKVLNDITISPSPTPFRVISLLDIDHGTLILDYFNDPHLLIHLAFSLYPQFGDQALKKIALDYLDTKDENDEQDDVGMDIGNAQLNEDADDAYMMAKEDSDVDLEVLDEAPKIFKTPRKKKAFKAKEQLVDSFLRCSRRLSNKAEGFKDAKSAQKAKVHDDEEKSTKKKSKKAKSTKSSKKPKNPAQSKEEPRPLAMIYPPRFAPAPHLPQDMLQGIGQGFLQIEPESVSAALLKHDNIDE
jgi:hypothetical protein